VLCSLLILIKPRGPPQNHLSSGTLESAKIEKAGVVYIDFFISGLLNQVECVNFFLFGRVVVVAMLLLYCRIFRNGDTYCW